MKLSKKSLFDALVCPGYLLTMHCSQFFSNTHEGGSKFLCLLPSVENKVRQDVQLMKAVASLLG